jgi:NAD(P)-dependent dehydrogenase (short-subunit alcohol dehydrogenase family)
MDLQLKGKKVLITGGSKGIGLAVAAAFAAEGALPIITSRDAKNLENGKAHIESTYKVACQTVELDLAAPKSAEALFEKIGNVDILINNAGAIPGGTLADINEEKWRNAWELKLFGYINLTRIYLAAMEKQGSGVIGNIIGMAGAAPRAEYVCGVTANAALMAFTQAVGATSHKNGIRVFGINPSPTRSDRMENMMKANAKNKLGDEARWTELTQKLPFGRMTEPDEIAHLTAFCASPLCGYLSGSVINVDGGQMFAPV